MVGIYWGIVAREDWGKAMADANTFLLLLKVGAVLAERVIVILSTHKWRNPLTCFDGVRFVTNT